MIKITRSKFEVKDLIVSFIGSIVPTFLVFWYLSGRYQNLISLFFNAFFIIYVPVFTIILSKRVEKFQGISRKFVIAPILIRFVLGLILTALILRPLVSQSTVVIEMAFYFILGPILLLLDLNKK